MGGLFFSLSHEVQELQNTFDQETIVHRTLGIGLYEALSAYSPGIRVKKKRAFIEQTMDTSNTIHVLLEKAETEDITTIVAEKTKQIEQDTVTREPNGDSRKLYTPLLTYLRSGQERFSVKLETLGELLLNHLQGNDIAPFYNRQSENRDIPPKTLRHEEPPVQKTLGKYYIDILRRESSAIQSTLDFLLRENAYTP